MARTLLYSAVPIVAKGFAVVLSSLAEFDLVAVCSSVAQLPQAVAASDPDLVVIDIDEEMSLDRLFELRGEISPRSNIILWVHSITPELAYQTMRLGVRGILRKTLGADTIIKCLQKVAEGECWFEEALTASFLSLETMRLTRRESQLISLVSRGLKNKEIADALFIAEPTVKIYLSRLFRKVGAKDRFELALYGLRNMIGGQMSLLSETRLPVLLVEDAGRRAQNRPQPLPFRSIA
jgi:two-component system nitrate/nitrite response regulator NarL